MPIKFHQCDSAKIDRVAYDAEARRLYVEFKPKGAVYAYENVDPGHFEYISLCKEAYAQSGIDNLLFVGLPDGVPPGSEGSYIVRVIVGKRGETPPFEYRKLDDDEAAAIFAGMEVAK